MNIYEEISRNEVLKSVNKLIVKQTEKGIAKYRKTVNAEDYSLVGWIEHCQQEIVDTLIYLECIRQKVIKGGR